MKSLGTAVAAAPTTLAWGQALAVVGIAAGLVVVIGIVVIIGRSTGGKDPEQSVVRSWIALTLVGGLVLFCAVTFAINDPNLRSTVFGGLTASAGAAVAFYFSSKASDQARKDILTATFGTETIPDLTNKTEVQATTALGTTSLKLEVAPDSSKDATAVVKTQNPPKDSVVRKGSSVVVTLGPPDGPIAPQPGGAIQQGPAAGGGPATADPAAGGADPAAAGDDPAAGGDRPYDAGA